jgi:homoserine kinase
VVLSPELEIETSASRRSLPREIPFAEVVKSLNSLAFIVSVFATGQYEKLRGAVTDFIHQPYRLPSIPGGEAAIQAGVEAGAYAGWLSGSGSSLLCVGPAGETAKVAPAMGQALEKRGIRFQANVLRCDNEGLRVSQIPVD